LRPARTNLCMFPNVHLSTGIGAKRSRTFSGFPADRGLPPVGRSVDPVKLFVSPYRQVAA
jgi:hypothetical protein